MDFLSTRFTRLVSVRSFSSVFSTRLARSSIISIKENKDAWLILQKYLGSHQSLIAVVVLPSNNSLNCSEWEGFKELMYVLWKLQFWFIKGWGWGREGRSSKEKNEFNTIPGDRGEMSKVQGKESMTQQIYAQPSCHWSIKTTDRRCRGLQGPLGSFLRKLLDDEI